MAETSSSVANHDVRAHAEQLLTQPVSIGDLALAFDETRAASAEMLVAGAAFYPRMLADIEGASASIHVNQFGFKPGVVGDRFAEVLARKASDGVPVRIVVDMRGSAPDEGSRDLYQKLTAAGVEVCVVRATKIRSAVGPLGGSGVLRWNLSSLGHFDHRKMTIVDGRIGWVGGAGIEDHFGDGRFHDLFVRVTGPVVSQLALVFLASFRWLGGNVPPADVEALFPSLDAGPDAVPAIVLHNAPGRYRPITTAIGELIDGARETLDIANPYVSDAGMIRRIAAAARRSVRVRLFVPANANNWACAAAQQAHHGTLLDAGVRIIEHPAMLHAKAFVRDREEVLAGTCNLEAWSLKRFFEIDVRVRSRDLAAQFEERFAAPAEQVSSEGRRLTGRKERAKSRLFAAISPAL
jgi:cardiolipin synthase A/B